MVEQMDEWWQKVQKMRAEDAFLSKYHKKTGAIVTSYPSSLGFSADEKAGKRLKMPVFVQNDYKSERITAKLRLQ